MADIVARLKLDNKDYNKKIEEAKKSTEKLSKEGGSLIDKFKENFTALAVAAAACKAAQEAFNAVIASSQSIGDAYTQMVEGAKGAVDEFAYAISNADFTSFERGLYNVVAASKACAAALDQLWNTKQSASYFTQKNKSKLAELLNTIKDESKTAEQRKQAQAMIDAILADQQEVVATTRQDVENAIFAMVNKAAGGKLKEGAVDRALIEETLRIDVSADRDELKKQIEDAYDEYVKLSAEISSKHTKTSTTMSGFGGSAVTTTYVSKEGKEALAELDAKYSDIIAKHSLLAVMSDDELKALIDELNYTEQQSKEMQEMVAQSVELNNRTIAQAAAQKKVTEAVKDTSKAYAAVMKAQSKAMGTSQGLFEGVTETHTPKKKEMPLVAASPIQDKIEGFEPVAVFAEGSYEAFVAAQEGIDGYAESANNAVEAVNALSSTMSSLSSIVGEDAAAWLDWGMGVAQAVAQAIPQIAALTTAKTTEATANTASAATGAASSVASVPYVGPILAIAAVASVLAALANLPKFATGGIVPGANLSGDNVLIRANSQEMVLNRDQQNILSKRLNGGMNGKVTFEIKGQKLVGILNNQNRINSQNYGG